MFICVAVMSLVRESPRLDATLAIVEKPALLCTLLITAHPALRFALRLIQAVEEKMNTMNIDDWLEGLAKVIVFLVIIVPILLCIFMMKVCQSSRYCVWCFVSCSFLPTRRSATVLMNGK